MSWAIDLLKNFTADGVEYRWQKEPDRESFRRIMFESFLFCYRDLTQADLQIDTDKKTWLSSCFSDEFLDQLKLPNSPYRLLAALKESAPVGYALFDLSLYPHQVYLSELAVDLRFQGKGIGKQLVFAPLQSLPDTKKIVLITRKANAQAKAFYKAIGFSPSSFIEKGYSPDLYTGYEYSRK